MEKIQPGSDARKNWKLINAHSDKIRDLERGLGVVEREIAPLIKRSLDYAEQLLPFVVYTTGNTKRVVEDADWWRKFKVRHGYVNLVKTTGCDDTDGEGTTATEIEVPAGTASYKVWVEVTLSGGTVSAAEIKHGAAGWTSYPTQSGLPTKYYVLLARIDTLTFEAEGRAIVRQFVTGDVTISSVGGAGADPVWLP